MIKHLFIAISLSALAATALAQNENASAIEPRARVAGPAPSNQVVVTGVVPDERTKAAVLARLRDIYDNNRVIDEVTIGDVVAPPSWNTYLERMLVADLAKISRGKLVVNGNDARISGDVANEAQRQGIVSQIATQLNPSYSIQNNLAIGSSRQEILDATLGNRTIEFESGSAQLTDRGLEIVDEMMEPIRQLSDQTVEIIGHTDNRGQQSDNLALSANRAEAVKQSLVARGVAANSLVTLGAGEQRPIASNDTAEGRKRNRRIEFQIRSNKSTATR